jgi:hypothetical protein
MRTTFRENGSKWETPLQPDSCGRDAREKGNTHEEIMKKEDGFTPTCTTTAHVVDSASTPLPAKSGVQRGIGAISLVRRV